MTMLPAVKKPCAECPWRTDVETGRFPPERFLGLAHTAYDMSLVMFACHKAQAGHEAACAGFLLRGATHNLSVRLAASYDHLAWGDIKDGGYPLYPNFKAVAVANGVDPDDPILTPCR